MCVWSRNVRLPPCRNCVWCERRWLSCCSGVRALHDGDGRHSNDGDRTRPAPKRPEQETRSWWTGGRRSYCFPYRNDENIIYLYMYIIGYSVSSDGWMGDGDYVDDDDDDAVMQRVYYECHSWWTVKIIIIKTRSLVYAQAQDGYVKNSDRHTSMIAMRRLLHPLPQNTCRRGRYNWL